MGQDKSRSRFGGLDSAHFDWTDDDNASDNSDYIPGSGADPWGKLATDMNTVGLKMIRRSSKTCPVCRSKMEYISLGEYRCTRCRRVERDDYGKVRAYIDEHGPSGAVEIEKATGVPRETVDALLRKGKLEIVNGPAGYLRCEICGEEIRYGRICSKCARTDGAKMRGYYVEDVGDSPYGTKDPGEMRFLKKRKERKETGFKKMGRR